MRQLAAWEAQKATLEALECIIYVASVDTLEQAQEVIAKAGLTYHVAYEVTKEESERFGAWWSENRGGHIQPSEFLLGRDGVVLGSMYASGALGRMSADEAVHIIIRREERRKQEQATS